MNLVDYGVLMSKQLRKLPESKKLSEGWDKIHKHYNEKYADCMTQPLNTFIDMLRLQCSKHDFFGWEATLTIFRSNIENPSEDTPQILLDELQILLDDSDLLDYVNEMTVFARKIHTFTQQIYGSADIKEIPGLTSTHKLRYSIKDLAIAVNRTGFVNMVLGFAKKHGMSGEALKSNKLYIEYEKKRQELAVLPYSQEYLELRKEYSMAGLCLDSIDFAERLNLFQNVINKSIFSGFWNSIIELDESSLELWPSNIPEKMVCHTTFINYDLQSELEKHGSWLYKISTKQNTYYVFVESKDISWDKNAKSELFGLIYPSSDVDFFIKESIFEYKDEA